MFSYKNKSGWRGMTMGGAEGGNVEILANTEDLE